MIARLATASLVVGLLCPASARAEDPEPVTVRAYRLTQPLVFDGRLDDAVYHSIEPAPAFKQQEPKALAPCAGPTARIAAPSIEPAEPAA